MELILLTGEHPDVIYEQNRQFLLNAGYLFLDPDHYLESDMSVSALRLDEFYRAKQWCLLEALQSVQSGLSVVLNSDYINASDLQAFRDLTCDVHFVDAVKVPTFLLNKHTPYIEPIVLKHAS